MPEPPAGSCFLCNAPCASSCPDCSRTACESCLKNCSKCGRRVCLRGLDEDSLCERCAARGA